MERTALILIKMLNIIDVFRIPMLTILLLSIKYSWQKKPTVEYSKAVDMDFGIAGTILGACCIFIILGIWYIQLVFTYRCWHFELFHSVTNKTHSKIDMISYGILCITIFSFVFLKDSFVIYRVVTILLNLPLVYMYYRYLPYYNEKINFLKSSTPLVIIISNVVMLIGYFAFNSAFCLLGFLLIIPVGVFIWHSVFLYRIKTVKILPLQCSSNIWDFELGLREKIKSNEGADCKLILEEFSKFYDCNCEAKKTIFILWRASFSISFPEIQKLAILDLNWKGKEKPTMEEEFQLYFMKRQIKNLCIVYPEYNLIKRYLKNQTAKIDDKKTCYNLLNFFELITSKNFELDKLEESIKIVVESTYQCNENYKKTSRKFPDSIETLQLHSTFLTTYLGKQEKSKELQSKKEFLLKHQNKETESSFIFKDQNPFLIVSAETHNIGTILYANQKYKNWMQDPGMNSIGKDLADLFPSSFEFLSNKNLKKFVVKPSNDLKYLDISIPVITVNKCLEESRVFILLMGYEVQFFLVLFNKPCINREIFLIDKNGFIEGWSLGINSSLMIGCIEVGMNIDAVLSINLKKLQAYGDLEININKRYVIARYHEEAVHGYNVRFVNLYLDEESLKMTLSSFNYMNKLVEVDKTVKFNSLRQNTFNNDNAPRRSVISINDNHTNQLKFDHESSSSTRYYFARRAFLYSTQCIKSLKILKAIFTVFVMAN